MDPQSENDSVTFSVLGNIYEPLVEFDSNMRIASCLAERWENPSDLVWRFYLRPHILFHNGKTFTADDVVYTIQRGLQQPGIRPYLISVKEAKKVSDHVIDIVTERPTPVLLNRLTFIFILPSTNDSKAITHPIGTGPYKFETEQGLEKITLRANEKYWRGKPTIAEVHFVHYQDDDTMVKHLLTGDVQLARDFPERLIPELKRSARLNMITQDSLGVALLGFNLSGDPRTNPFLKRDVRLAVYHAIDPNQLVQKTLLGQAIVANQLMSPNVFGFDPAFAPLPRDGQKVKALLSRAGFSTGLKTELYGNDNDRLQEVAALMNAAGIRTTAHLITWNELYGKLMKHEIPLFTFSWNSATGDASDFLDSCVHSPKPSGGYGNYNFADYRNGLVDKYIEQSSGTLKVTDRKQFLQKALGAALTDLPYIPLYSRFRQYSVSNDVEWHPRGDGRLYAFDVRWKGSR